MREEGLSGQHSAGRACMDGLCVRVGACVCSHEGSGRRAVWLWRVQGPREGGGEVGQKPLLRRRGCRCAFLGGHKGK